jgi:hypothetical protein
MQRYFIFIPGNIKDYFLIIGAALVFLILLIANPGYFSHDELQRFDYLSQHGFLEYFRNHVKLYHGDTFGTPVRPFSFFIQGILAFFMENYVVLVHLFAVLVHALVGCLLYSLFLQFGINRSLGLKMALLFIVNPLSIFAVGWSAALMDQWYVLFGLLTLKFSDIYVRKQQGLYLIFFVFVCSLLAVLSKETAVILPGLIFVIGFVDPNTLKNKKLFIILTVWVSPILLLLVYRFSALIASFDVSGFSPYNASVNNFPENILVYFAYPFLINLTEVGNWVFIDSVWIWLSLAFHLLLTVSIFYIFGYRLFIFYWFFYFLFLFPVLFITIKGGHYLYGSSITLSMGVASLLHQNFFRYFSFKILGILSFSLLILHSYYVQDYIYSLGTCMNRAMNSSESLYLSHNRPLAMDFRAEPGAPAHILHRIYTGRDQIGRWFPVKLTISQWGTSPTDNVLSFEMDKNCIVHSTLQKKSDAEHEIQSFVNLVKIAMIDSNFDVERIKKNLGVDAQGRFNSELGTGYVGYEESIAKQYILLSGITFDHCIKLIKELSVSFDIRVGRFDNSVQPKTDSSVINTLCKSGDIWFVM